MSETKLPKGMSKTGTTILRLRQIQDDAKAWEGRLRKRFSEMAAESGYDGTWESKFVAGHIRIWKTAKLVKDREDLAVDEKESLIAEGLAKHVYQFCTPTELKELLDEKEIEALITKGVIKKEFKTIGPGTWNQIPLSDKLVKAGAETKINHLATENMVAWTNSVLKVSGHDPYTGDDEEYECTSCSEKFDDPLIDIPNEPGLYLCGDCWSKGYTPDSLDDFGQAAERLGPDDEVEDYYPNWWQGS